MSVENAPVVAPQERLAESQAVVPTSSDQLPADPMEILIRQDAGQQAHANRRKWVMWGAGGLLVLQLVAPPAMKPATIVGGIFGQFYAPIMEQSLRKEVMMREQAQLASELARLQAAHSNARAKCGFGVLLGEDAIRLCNMAVDQNFLPAIRQIRGRLRQLGN